MRITYPIYLKSEYHLTTQLFSYLFLINTILIVLFQISIVDYVSKFNQFLIAALGSFLVITISVSSTFASQTIVLDKNNLTFNPVSWACDATSQDRPDLTIVVNNTEKLVYFLMNIDSGWITISDIKRTTEMGPNYPSQIFEISPHMYVYWHCKPNGMTKIAHGTYQIEMA